MVSAGYRAGRRLPKRKTRSSRCCGWIRASAALPCRLALHGMLPNSHQNTYGLIGYCDQRSRTFDQLGTYRSNGLRFLIPNRPMRGSPARCATLRQRATGYIAHGLQRNRTYPKTIPVNGFPKTHGCPPNWSAAHCNYWWYAAARVHRRGSGRYLTSGVISVGNLFR